MLGFDDYVVNVWLFLDLWMLVVRERTWCLVKVYFCDDGDLEEIERPDASSIRDSSLNIPDFSWAGLEATVQKGVDSKGQQQRSPSKQHLQPLVQQDFLRQQCIPAGQNFPPHRSRSSKLSIDWSSLSIDSTADSHRHTTAIAVSTTSLGIVECIRFAPTTNKRREIVECCYLVSWLRGLWLPYDGLS